MQHIFSIKNYIKKSRNQKLIEKANSDVSKVTKSSLFSFSNVAVLLSMTISDSKMFSNTAKSAVEISAAGKGCRVDKRRGESIDGDGLG